MNETNPSPRSEEVREPLFVHRRGDGPIPCIFLHGHAEGSYVWVDVLDNLPGSFRAYAVDLRGHGYSPRSTDGHYLVSEHAKDVCRVLDTLQGEPVVLVGHSMGGDIAARITIARPESVRALVLVDVGLRPRHAVVFNANLRLYRSLRTYASIDEYFQTLVRSRPLVPRNILRHCAAEALDGDPQSGFRLRVDPRFFQPANNPRNDTVLDPPMLSRITCQTLFVRGAVSAVVSREAALEVTSAIRGCEFSEIDHAGHAPMLENPVAFRTRLIEFLEAVKHHWRCDCSGHRLPSSGASGYPAAG